MNHINQPSARYQYASSSTPERQAEIKIKNQYIH